MNVVLAGNIIVARDILTESFRICIAPESRPVQIIPKIRSNIARRILLRLCSGAMACFDWYCRKQSHNAATEDFTSLVACTIVAGVTNSLCRLAAITPAVPVQWSRLFHTYI